MAAARPLAPAARPPNETEVTSGTPATPDPAPARAPRIGVLALQGSFSLHAAALRRLGAEVIEVRKAPALGGLDGLILPGGESSTMLKLLLEEDLVEPLLAFHRSGGFLYGTCAGAILLASSVENPEQESLGLLDITVRRNGYGRQRDSHLGTAACAELGAPPLPVVLIRAPVITRTGPSVEVLAEWRGQPAFVREGRVFATTFHPELTDDARVHAAFATAAGSVRAGNAGDGGARNAPVRNRETA